MRGHLERCISERESNPASAAHCEGDNNDDDGDGYQARERDRDWLGVSEIEA